MGWMESPRILVVDDEPMVTEVVERYLEREGYSVRTAADGLDGLDAFGEMRPHLVVLDLMLPRLGGMDICRRIRESSRTPIIMLTARGDEMDRIAGFEIGADDYLAKPFSPNELIARVRALLRRAQRAAPRPDPTIRYGPLIVDAARHTVSLDGDPATLTAKEFLLLAYLLHHCFNLLRLCDITLDYERFPDFCRYFHGVRLVLALRVGDVIDYALRTMSAERLDHLRAHPSRAARDEHNFPGEIQQVAHDDWFVGPEYRRTMNAVGKPIKQM